MAAPARRAAGAVPVHCVHVVVNVDRSQQLFRGGVRLLLPAVAERSRVPVVVVPVPVEVHVVGLVHRHAVEGVRPTVHARGHRSVGRESPLTPALEPALRTLPERGVRRDHVPAVGAEAAALVDLEPEACVPAPPGPPRVVSDLPGRGHVNRAVGDFVAARALVLGPSPGGGVGAHVLVGLVHVGRHDGLTPGRVRPDRGVVRAHVRPGVARLRGGDHLPAHALSPVCHVAPS